MAEQYISPYHSLEETPIQKHRHPISPSASIWWIASPTDLNGAGEKYSPPQHFLWH